MDGDVGDRLLLLRLLPICRERDREYLNRFTAALVSLNVHLSRERERERAGRAGLHPPAHISVQPYARHINVQPPLLVASLCSHLLAASPARHLLVAPPAPCVVSSSPLLQRGPLSRAGLRPPVTPLVRAT